MVIEKYTKEWVNQFSQIEEILKQNLSKFIKIEHVGSTAIIGMCAKPIIDIIIVIESMDDFDIIKNELNFIGYFHNGNQGIEGREVFNREKIIYNKTLDEINHHLYVCTKDNDEYKRHILFRNYLNKNENEKQEYNKIKMEIIEKIGNENRKEYVEIKETEYSWFFEKVIRKAGEFENMEKEMF